MSAENVSSLTALINAPFVDRKGTCDVHGDYTTTVLVICGKAQPVQCMDCLQMKIRAEREEEAQRIADEAHGKAKRSRLSKINLPKRMLDKRWSDYSPANAQAERFLTICKDYATDWQSTRDNGANLIMTGKTGNGKTHLASVLCKQVAAENTAQPLYTTVSAMLRYIRASFGKGCEYTESQAMARYATADLLVIDEVGVKLSSEYDKSTLFEIIDERYQEQLPNVVISNLSVKEIEDHIDARMVDRLSENGTLMIFDWASHRGTS